MYTGETMLTYGKYKFYRLREVPADYLLNIYNNKDKRNPELFEYIERNIETIKYYEGGTLPFSPTTFTCSKLTFATEKIAKEILRDIAHKEQKHKKPVRAYYCDNCGGWHLTSKPLKESKY